MRIEDLIPLLTPWTALFGLTLARTSGFILALPHLSWTAIPAQVKAIVALALALALTTSQAVVADAPTNLSHFVWYGALNFGYGLGLGFVLQVALSAARVAGEIIGIEMGLSFAAVADPLTQTQSTAVSAILGQLLLQLFLALGYDRVAIRALAHTFDRPPAEAELFLPELAPLVGMLDGLMNAAMSFALPVTGSILVLKVALAMLARAAPKLQIFTLAFALTAGLGLVILHLALPNIASSFADYLRSSFLVLGELVAASR